MSAQFPIALSNEIIRQKAPSVFAEVAHPEVSSRYSFLPTINVVDGLRESGWLPVAASEQRIREAGRRGFQKHMLRFQRADDVASYADQEALRFAPSEHRIVKGEARPEIVLVNSHDRSSAYQIHAGIFRLVCANGLIICDSTIGRASITHLDFDPAAVITASLEIASHAGEMMEKVESWQARVLSEVEQRAFAEAAILLRHEDLKTAPVSAEKVLEARRYEDAGNDLWRTFNRVQENLVKGGQKDYRRRVPALMPDGSRSETRLKRAPKTRAVEGIDSNLRLNKALWHMAEVLKAGGNPAAA